MLTQLIVPRTAHRAGASLSQPQKINGANDAQLLSDCYGLHGTAATYGLRGVAATYGLPRPSPLLDDCAIIKKKGLRRHLQLTNPTVNPRQEKHELVIDADDLAVAVVPDHGSAIIPVGHIASGVFLGAGIGLAGWFSLAASIKEMGDATRILRRLRLERKMLEEAAPDVRETYPWRVKKERLKRAMLLENRTDKWEQRTRAIFSGGLVTASSIAEIYGYLASPILFGGLSPAMAASSAIALTIAAPMVSVFAGANALLQFHRVYREIRNKKLVKEVASANPWGQDVFDAHTFVEGRRKQVRNHALATGSGFVGISLGVPLTFFGGGYGLAFLLPGILTVFVANQYESRKIEHNYPMTIEEIQHLALARHIVGDMGLAYQEYKLLKDIKVAKRRDYLAGAHLGPISRCSLAPVRAAQRWMGRARHNKESSKRSLYQFFGARLQLLETHLGYKIEGYLKHYHEADEEVQALLDVAYKQRRELRHDRASWTAEWWRYKSLTPRVTLTRLCNVLVSYDVFKEFALRVVTDKRLKSVFKTQAGSVALKPKDIIDITERQGAGACRTTQRLYKIAEVLILMVVKARRHSRARELADLAIDRKRAKLTLDKRHGAIVAPGQPDSWAVAGRQVFAAP